VKRRRVIAPSGGSVTSVPAHDDHDVAVAAHVLDLVILRRVPDAPGHEELEHLALVVHAQERRVHGVVLGPHPLEHRDVRGKERAAGLGLEGPDLLLPAH
jgi:hypothetical protein